MGKHNDATRERLLVFVGEWFDKTSKHDPVDDGVPCGELKLSMMRTGYGPEPEEEPLVTVYTEESTHDAVY